MKRAHPLVFFLPILILALFPGVPSEGVAAAAAGGDRTAHGRFTSEHLTVFYVSDVLRSVSFYRDALGFELHHFYDYDAGKRLPEWTRSEPPIWAEMAAGDLTFGLHRIREDEELRVGGNRHYFHVEDVDSHHRRVRAHGVATGPIIDRPWMRMFSVNDPDGHSIYFATPVEESRTVGAEREVQKRIEALIEADNRGDLEAVVACYGDDAVLIPPGDPPVSGKEAIRERYRKIFAESKLRVRLEPAETRVADRWAFSRGVASGTASPVQSKGGSETRSIHDDYLMILRKGDDDAWRVSRLIWNGRDE